jgi:hypothetical protein
MTATPRARWLDSGGATRFTLRRSKNCTSPSRTERPDRAIDRRNRLALYDSLWTCIGVLPELSLPQSLPVLLPQLRALVTWCEQQMLIPGQSHREMAMHYAFRAFIVLCWYLLARSDEMYTLTREQVIKEYQRPGSDDTTMAVMLRWRKTNQSDSRNGESVAWILRRSFSHPRLSESARADVNRLWSIDGPSDGSSRSQVLPALPSLRRRGLFGSRTCTYRLDQLPGQVPSKAGPVIIRLPCDRRVWLYLRSLVFPEDIRDLLPPCR